MNYKNKKSGKIYTFIKEWKVKDAATREWTAMVAYSDTDKNEYHRELSDFLNDFELLEV